MHEAMTTDLHGARSTHLLELLLGTPFGPAGTDTHDACFLLQSASVVVFLMVSWRGSQPRAQRHQWHSLPSIFSDCSLLACAISLSVSMGKIRTSKQTLRKWHGDE